MKITTLKRIFLFTFILTSLWTTNVLNAQNKFVPGMDLIGKTYNIFTGEYADNGSVITTILNFDKAPKKVISYQNVSYNIPTIFNYTPIGRARTEIITGENTNEISDRLGISAGLEVDAVVFSATVNAEQFKASNKSVYTYFSKYFYIVANHRIELEQANIRSRRANLIENLEPYLTSAFEKYVNDPTFSPEDFFNSYGTHFLADIILGAKIEIDTRLESKSALNETDRKLSVSARYQNVGASAGVETGNSTSNSNVNFYETRDAKGGNISLLGNSNQVGADYQRWAKTVKNSPVLVDFNKNSLIPLWLFAKDPVRRAQLSDYFNKVLTKKYKKPAPVKYVPEAPKAVVDFKINNPKGDIVEAHMKGVTKGSGWSVTAANYDNTKIWLTADKSYKNNSESYWYFYNVDDMRKNAGKSGFHSNGNTSKKKYDENVNDLFRVISPNVNSNGEFYLYVKVENDNFSGARANNDVQFKTWKRSDKPIKVIDVNNNKRVKVTFFNGDLSFDIKF